jgi:hypothetical protein
VQLDRAMWHSPDDDRRLTMGPFVDYGHGGGPGSTSIALSSVGVAARLAWRRFTASLAIARRLTHPDLGPGSHRGLQGQGIHFEIAYTAF